MKYKRWKWNKETGLKDERTQVKGDVLIELKVKGWIKGMKGWRMNKGNERERVEYLEWKTEM